MPDPTYNFSIRCETDDPDADVYVKEAAEQLAGALEHGPDGRTTYRVEAFASGKPLLRHGRGRVGRRETAPPAE
jgi:hypothetical protein